MLKTNQIQNLAGTATVTVEEIIESTTDKKLTIEVDGACLIVGGIPDTASFINGKALNGTDMGWYVGRGVSTTNDIYLHNYALDADTNFVTTGAGQVLVNGTPIVAVGEIKQWAGKLTAIPNGWNLADGSKGTVDMTADFKSYGVDTVVFIQYIGA